MATLTAPTLERLIKEARIQLNQRDSDNSFWEDDELTVYANDAIRKYFAILVDNNEGQYDTVADLDITENVETVDLPDDCYKVRFLYKNAGGNEYFVLPYRNSPLESYSTAGGTSSTNYSPYYYFRGDAVVLRPIPNFSETAGLRLEYTAFPETLIWGGDSMTGLSPVFKELIVSYMVWKAKVKESMVTGTDTSSQASQILNDCVTNFMNTVSSRSKYPTFVKPFTP